MDAHENFFPLHHWNIFQAHLVWAYERQFPIYRKWSYIPSPDAAWLILKGKITLNFESGIENYDEGMWVFPKNAEAIQEFTGGTRILALRFHAGWSFGASLFDRRETLVIKADKAPTFTRDAKKLVKCINNLFPENATRLVAPTSNLDGYLMIQPLLLRCVASYYFTLKANHITPNIPGVICETLRIALHYLETEPLNTILHERDLAKKVGISVSQLNRIFARDLRTTPAAIWNKRKLNSACSQLIVNDANIKQIAYTVGFSSPEHFSTWFRKQTKVAPRIYRQQYQASRNFLL